MTFTYTPPPPSLLTESELARLGVRREDELYLRTSVDRDEVGVVCLVIEAWRHRTFGIVHGYVGSVTRYR